MAKRKTDRNQPEIPSEEPPSPLKRVIAVDSIRDGLEETASFTPAELEEIKTLQDLQSLDRFGFVYTLNRVSGGGVTLKGKLTADATQTCVVSLDPVPASLEIPVEADYLPQSAIERWQAELDEETLSDPLAEWPEPIQGGKIDIGPLIYESFATALDPYPRKEGANLDWEPEQGDEPEESAKENPFSILERLKR
ncbi:DUF177 domain-containing protein [Methyloligella sp. 2.7D]|uniref:YceD family protein n=1 Tax=unclassified Methyloligella TaxID=2625955 RepID=UPI00157DCAB3|nr:DUF177 domain-containing protein [Methyloligella sp. GL2]QKP77590.1 DUF177 domain-containing protein [Methyloligella sp. GL2]